MHIAVTGGTGYLGAHTVRALLAAGHTVRLLVFPGGSDDAALDALGRIGPLEILTGDIRDPATVSELLTGCDAALHAAGVVGTDSRRTQPMWDINAYATEALLTRACELGLDPVVSVSSYSSLFPPADGVIGPDTPPAPGRSDYARTKAYADNAARRLQSEGAPVVVTYPSSVVGPAFHTAVGVTQRGWDPIVRYRVAPQLRGGMQMIDVGDVARVHTALMRPGRGPKRYVCGGVLLTFDQMVDALQSALGRPIRRIPLSPGMFRGVGRVSDVAGRWLPLAEGLSYEAALLLTAAVPTDDSLTLSDLTLTWRDPRESIVESFA
ncbi:NAD-dependent epimerase/dehydratase family protein [Mycolicibacterium mucogenicum]|uniref:NAD-dependent epimerase/dehydratase family protein n=1 Tax=Mycolicibacterium mucogenicum TaxID=56689 RepID=UPI00226A55F1|nr:NAD-dependent epimerase/dehydratase family protein [Mycolicibacterium mucogenicum]MCX8555040.1 NAD-dependent epimerase/dehydratase family protein [Mycolicibacterium mucogenicum]